MPLSVALVHYPTTNKNKTVVATSVTNFDIHDIARASRTFGVSRYYIVHPMPMQRAFVKRVMTHWLEGEGADYNPTRGDALKGVEIVADLAEVDAAIRRDFGAEPFWVATSAKRTGATISAPDLRLRIEAGLHACLIFGTGYGLHPEVIEMTDALLEPINGPTEFNHLSVRSAVSIYLDRLMGNR